MNCQTDFDAAIFAASGVCILSCLYIGTRCAPPSLRNKYIQQKQQRQQHQNPFCHFIQLNIPLPRDVMGLNIHRQMGVKLNELAKRILMLLPLLLLLHVLYHVLMWGRFAPPYNYVVSTYSRSSRGSSIKICFANSFSLTFNLSGSTN